MQNSSITVICVVLTCDLYVEMSLQWKSSCGPVKQIYYVYTSSNVFNKLNFYGRMSNAERFIQCNETAFKRNANAATQACCHSVGVTAEPSAYCDVVCIPFIDLYIDALVRMEENYKIMSFS